jgi:DNA-binding MarR family transcriptional regulator
MKNSVATKTTSTSFEFHNAPGHLIRRAQQIAVAIFVEETQGLDITPIQFAFLSELSAHPEIDQASLASQIAVDVATLGQVAIRLADRGLIEREVDPLDRRCKRLVVSAAGAEALKRLEPRVKVAQQRIMKPLTSAEAKTFMLLLNKIVGGNNGASRAPMASRKTSA